MTRKIAQHSKTGALHIWIALFFLTTFGTLAVPTETQAAGPWNGQIADKETGEPLEGVVVVAVWNKCFFIIMNGCGKYYDSEEVVTGPDGRFLIQDRSGLPIIRPLKGPYFYLFKPSYGQWQFKGQDAWSEDGVIHTRQRQDALRQFHTKEGVVLELPLLKSKQERLDFYHSPGWAPRVAMPDNKIKRWKEAEAMERSYLGFQSR